MSESLLSAGRSHRGWVSGRSDAEATRLRLVRRIAQVEEQLDACDRELAELKDSPLWKWKVLVDEASARGKNSWATWSGA